MPRPSRPLTPKTLIALLASRIDNPETLRPTVPVTKSGPMKIAGRRLEVHVAPFAATEADLWLYVPDEGLAIVGDLVVDIVPFMDTAAPTAGRRR